MTVKPPVAYSQRYYERTLVSANRFLGLPNPVWSFLITSMLAMTGWVASGMKLGGFVEAYGVWLVLVALLLWLALKCITPSRAVLKRLALKEHQTEVLKVANAYGIDPTSVRFVDSEEERQTLEIDMPSMDPRLSL